MRNGDDFSPAVIDRSASLLDQFRDNNELTLSQLASRTGLPRSSAHRLLTQLVEFGWMSRRGHSYALGRAMFEWGALTRHRDGLHQAAHPILHELHATTGLIVHLAILDGNDVRYLDKIGRGPIALPSRIGGRQPALRTALGKALVAHSEYDRTSGPSASNHLSSAQFDARLRREIAHIRLRHVAHEREESVPGVACVAAPIGNHRTCVAALSVAGPIDKVDIITLATPVRSAAKAVWQTVYESGFIRRAG